VKAYALIVKATDETETIEQVVEDRIVTGNFEDEDGATWQDVVDFFEKKHGKDNVRVEPVEIDSDLSDPDAVGAELYEKLNLTAKIPPSNN